MAVPAVGDLPFMDDLKEVGLSPLAEAPDFLRSLAWAAIVLGTLYALFLVTVRLGFPLLSRLLPEPVAFVVDRIGVALVLPEYLVTTLVRRTGRPLPRSLISYGDSVHEIVVATEALARAVLRRLGVLRTLPPVTIALALLVMTVGWNWTYCVGRDDSCQTPTSEWADSVSK